MITSCTCPFVASSVIHNGRVFLSRCVIDLINSVTTVETCPNALRGKILTIGISRSPIIEILIVIASSSFFSGIIEIAPIAFPEHLRDIGVSICGCISGIIIIPRRTSCKSGIGIVRQIVVVHNCLNCTGII